MAPQPMRARNVGRPGDGGKRKIAAPPPSQLAASALLLLDVLDYLGHVVLVLAELGCIFEQLFVLFFGLFERDGLFFLLYDISLVGLKIGIELLGSDGPELLLDRRRGTCTARFQKRLRIIRRITFRTDHGLAQQIVVARPAGRTNPLGAPFGFGHTSLHRGFARSSRRAIATEAPPCQNKHDANHRQLARRAPAYGATATRAQPLRPMAERPSWLTSSRPLRPRR